jgi:hypothetical protein
VDSLYPGVSVEPRGAGYSPFPSLRRRAFLILETK